MYFHKQQRSNKDVNHRLPNCLYISKNPRLVKLYFSPIVFVFIGYRCLFFWHTTLSYLSSSSPFLEPKLYTSILYPTFFSFSIPLFNTIIWTTLTSRLHFFFFFSFLRICSLFFLAQSASLLAVYSLFGPFCTLLLRWNVYIYALLSPQMTYITHIC